MKFLSFLRHWLTEKDNKTACPFRFTFLIGCACFFYGTIHDFCDPAFKFADHAVAWADSFKSVIATGLATLANILTEKGDNQ